MVGRTNLLAAAATLALTATSMAVLAATGAPESRGWTATGTQRGPLASSCQLPSSLPGPRVTVALADMGGMMGGPSMMSRGPMMLRPSRQTVPAGTVTFAAVNYGTRRHELVVLPLPSGTPAGARLVGADGKIDEADSLGEASRTCGDGSGDGIAPGTAGWVTITLRPGRYELLCNLPRHYGAGMFAEFDVT